MNAEVKKIFEILELMNPNKIIKHQNDDEKNPDYKSLI